MTNDSISLLDENTLVFTEKNTPIIYWPRGVLRLPLVFTEKNTPIIYWPRGVLRLPLQFFSPYKISN